MKQNIKKYLQTTKIRAFVLSPLRALFNPLIIMENGRYIT